MNNKGLYDLLTKIRIAKSNNKSFIKRCLDVFFSSTNMNNEESKTYIENLICYAENSTPEDAIFISPQKQEWLKEWLKGLSTTNSTPTKNKSTFRDRILTPNKDSVIETLRNLIKGKKGKSVALIIKAAIQYGIIVKPTFNEVEQTFGNIGAESNYNKYMNYEFTDEELDPIKKYFEF